MSDTDQSPAGIVHYSSDEILAHPRLVAARVAFVEAVLGLYEGNSFLTRLLLEAGRTVIFTVSICLHVRYDEADRKTWPTIGLLQELMTQFGLSSPRRIEALVGRLIHDGFLESVPSKRDGRARILTPTAKMLAHDQDWLAAHYLPLHVMFPEPGYSQVIERDPAFQRAQRVVAMDFLALGAKILASNPAMMLFMARDAGMMVLMKLIQMAGSAANQAPEGLSYADIGARFGVSRTHVRTLLQDVEQDGLVRLSGRGGRYVELMPPVLRAFDRFMADSMSGHDLLFRIALRQMAKDDA